MGMRSKIKEKLLGSWRLIRRINGMPEIVGEAEFSKNGEALVYREDVQVPAVKGQQLRAFREYIYEFEGSERFRLFHARNRAKVGEFMSCSFDPCDPGEPLTARGAYLCKYDLYEGDFKFHQEDRFSVTYKVLGPKKSYKITTEYVRQT